MSERAQALEAIDRMLSYMVLNAADRRVLSAEIRLAVYGPPPAGPTRQPDTGPPPPPPPVGSPTTERPTKPSREVPNLMKALLKSLEPPVVEPTPEPLTEKPPHYCVWRETPTSTMWPSCVGQIDPLPGYRFCPYCGHPLTVER